MNELQAVLPEILHSKIAKLGHIHVLTRLLGDHGLFQATPSIPNKVRCGSVFVRETRVERSRMLHDLLWLHCNNLVSFSRSFFPAALFAL